MYKLLIILSFFVLSCQTTQTSQVDDETEFITEAETNPIAETEVLIVEEDTTEMLPDIYQNRSPRIPDYFYLGDDVLQKFLSKEYTSWFKDKSGVRLYIVPYTDLTITTAYITKGTFQDEEITDFLRREFSKYDSTHLAVVIDKVESQEGLTIGSTYEEVEVVFGKPDIYTNNGSFINCKWNFSMIKTDEIPFGELTPFTLEGLLYHVEMNFMEDKVVTLLYQYQVP